MTFVLVGNYGVGNVGDEALKEYFLRTFTDVRWIVLSARPSGDELPRLPAGIRSFLGFQWIKTLRAIRTSDGVIFGGGTLFTDIESVYACFIWWIHAAVARFYGKKIILAFQGIGPFRTRIGERFARAVVGWSNHISVRDVLSADRIDSWKKNTEVVQSFDPAFSLNKDEKHVERSQNILSIIPRKNSGAELQKAAEMASNFSIVSILSLEPDHPGEKKVIRTLIDSLHKNVEVLHVRSAQDLLGAIAPGSTVITERYHGALAGIVRGANVIPVSQGSGDKLESVQEVLRVPEEERHAWMRDRIARGEQALRMALSTTEVYLRSAE